MKMCRKTILKMLHQHLQSSLLKTHTHKMRLKNDRIHLDKTQKMKTKCSMTTRGLCMYVRNDQLKLTP